MLIIFILFITTVAYGAFVAGLKAGLIYNTFPLMGDSIIPHEIFYFKPLWSNLFINQATVQFIHRMLATLVLIITFIFVFHETRKIHKPDLKISLKILVTIVTLQFVFGIATILSKVNMIIATAHQAIALVILKSIIIVLYNFEKPKQQSK